MLGVVLTPQDLELEKLGKGFHKLLNLGDYAVGIDGRSGSTTTARVQADPAVVDGMVAASLMGLRLRGGEPRGHDPADPGVPAGGRPPLPPASTTTTARPTAMARALPRPAEIVEHAAGSLETTAREGDALDFGPLDRAARELDMYRLARPVGCLTRGQVGRLSHQFSPRAPGYAIMVGNRADRAEVQWACENAGNILAGVIVLLVLGGILRGPRRAIAVRCVAAMLREADNRDVILSELGVVIGGVLFVLGLLYSNSFNTGLGMVLIVAALLRAVIHHSPA